MRRDDEHPLLLDASDIIDWPGFCSALNESFARDSPGLGKRIMQLLPDDARKIVSAPEKGEPGTSKFVAALNELLIRPDFYQTEDFKDLTLPEEVLALTNRKRNDLSQNELEWLNRLLLETTFPRQIAKFEPYVGPRSFQKEQRNFFFGRKREANELVALVTAHPIVLFYSQSGAGKTSLLNARLIPLLEEEEHFNVLGPMRVQGQIPAGMKVSKKANVYVLNALMSCRSENTNATKLAGMTFARFLAEKGERLNIYGEPCPTVIIFDQFEELFTFYAGRWEEREKFFRQISDALEGNPALGIKGDPLLRIVFSMREDYIAELHPYASLLPEKLQTRFRLEQLREEPALLAIKEPLAKISRTYASGVAEKLAKNLLRIPDQNTGEPEKFGMYIEPLQLQIVCQSLWQALKPTEKSITHKHLQKYGDVSQALSTFYERSIRAVAADTGVKEEALRTWFGETLITPEGVRAPVYRREWETGGLTNVAVDQLETIRLIKAESKGINVRWYELAHDRFIEPIKRSNERWLAEQSRSDQKRSVLEIRAAKWRQGNAGLLAPDELAEAKGLLKHWQGASKSLRDLVAASGASAQKRRLKLFGLGIAGLIVLVLVMSVLALYAWRKGKAAAKAEGVAKSRLIATKAGMYQDSDPEFSVLLANEAVKQFPHTEEAEEVIRTGLLSLSNVRGALRQEKGRIKNACFSRDQRYVLTNSDDGTARLWDAEARRLVSVLALSAEQIRSANFSHDGTLIVTTSTDGIGRVWDGKSGSFIRDLKGFVDREARPAFTPDDKLVLTGGNENAVVLWDPNTGEQINVLKGHEGRVTEIVISGDGTRVATEAADESGRIWYLNSKKTPIILKGLSGPRFAIAFSPDGKLVAAEGGPDTQSGADASTHLFPVTVWNTTTGKVQFMVAGHHDSITSIDFSSDGKYLVTSSNEGTAQVWDTKTNKLAAELRGHTKAILQAVFSPDSKFIVTASGDNTARIWNLDGQLVTSLRGHSGAVNSAEFSSDARLLVTSSDDMTARIWEWNAARDRVLNAHPGGSNSSAFSPDGKLIVTTGFDGKARLWEATSTVMLSQLEGHTDRVVNAAFSPDGKYLVTSSFDNTARIWSLDPPTVALFKGEAVKTQTISGNEVIVATFDVKSRSWKPDLSNKLIPPNSARPIRSPFLFADHILVHSDHVNKAVFSVDSKKVVTVSSDGLARVWDVATGQALGELAGHQGKVDGVAFSPDGRFIITAGNDGTVRIWDAATYAFVRILGQHNQPVYSAEYSPEGKFVVTSSADRLARVWNATTGQKVADLKGHTNEVNSASFSSDGKFIVTSSDDQTIRIWDTASWTSITVLHGHTGKVFSAAFSPNGQSLITASADGTARIYPLQAFATWEEVRRLIPERVTRNLTTDELEQFFDPLKR